MYLQQIPLVAALVQADAPLGGLDEVVFALLQLEHIHVGLLVDGPCVEEELVRRDGEQGLGHLTDLRQYLLCKNQRPPIRWALVFCVNDQGALTVAVVTSTLSLTLPMVAYSVTTA